MSGIRVEWMFCWGLFLGVGYHDSAVWINLGPLQVVIARD